MRKRQVELFEEKLAEKIECEECKGEFLPVLIPVPLLGELDPHLETCSACANVNCGFELDKFDPTDHFTFLKKRGPNEDEREECKWSERVTDPKPRSRGRRVGAGRSC